MGIGELASIGELGLHSLGKVSHTLKLKSSVNKLLVLNAGFEALAIIANPEVLSEEAIHSNNLSVELTFSLL